MMRNLPTKIGIRLKRELLAGFSLVGLRSHRRSALYLGWVGHQNIGDEALLAAVNGLLSPLQLISNLDPQLLAPKILVFLKNSIWCENLVIGGGTLINRGRWHRKCEVLQSVTRASACFGTGVADPEFWGSPSTAVRNSWLECLGRCCYIGVRGPRSLQVLEDWGIKHAKPIGDPALYFLGSVLRPTVREDLIGLNIGTALGRVWGSEVEIATRVELFVRKMLDLGYRIRFYVVWPGDWDIVTQLVKTLNNPNISVEKHYRDAHKYMASVGECVAFVGMKLHASILAMCAGVPSITLEYQPKCSDFMKFAGLSAYNVRTDHFTAETLVDRVVSLRENSDMVSNDILKSLGRIRKRLVTEAEELKTILMM